MWFRHFAFGSTHDPPIYIPNPSFIPNYIPSSIKLFWRSGLPSSYLLPGLQNRSGARWRCRLYSTFWQYWSALDSQQFRSYQRFCCYYILAGGILFPVCNAWLISIDSALFDDVFEDHLETRNLFSQRLLGCNDLVSCLKLKSYCHFNPRR